MLMTLALPQEFEEEMHALVSRELPDYDHLTATYLAKLFSTAQTPKAEEIRLCWNGLKKEIPSGEHMLGIFREKLDLARRVGDGCLVVCAFYREDRDTERITRINLSQPVKRSNAPTAPSVDRRHFAHEKPPNRPSAAITPIEHGLELIGLGKTGYNVAGFYSATLDEADSPVYPTLEREFPRIVVKLGHAILRDYLGVRNLPQRIVLYTPRGEMILRLRYSPN